MTTPIPLFRFLSLPSEVWVYEALTLHVLRNVALDILTRAAEGAWRPRGPRRPRGALCVHSTGRSPCREEKVS